MDFLKGMIEGNNFLIYIIAVIIIFVIIFTLIPFIKKIRITLGDFRINKSSNVSSHQYRQLLMGAIYSEQQSAYINSLETGSDRIKKIVNEWWGIQNSEEAVNILNNLYKKGFRYYLPVVYKAFLVDDEKEQKSIILQELLPKADIEHQQEEEIEEDFNKVFSQVEHLEETYDELLEDDIIQTKEDIERYGVTGWDCGRLNFLARICYDAGYITEDQAWDYIDKAYKLGKQSFTSWEDYARSYVIGRAMWGGQGSNNSGIALIAETLLTNPKSPWLEYKW